MSGEEIWGMYVKVYMVERKKENSGNKARMILRKGREKLFTKVYQYAYVWCVCLCFCERSGAPGRE